MVRATTPAPLSESDAAPFTKPVVYSPVPIMSTLTGRFASSPLSPAYLDTCLSIFTPNTPRSGDIGG
eukprot:CAMPEP_0173202842 /NCGR_PEP_ID=MMETSP1141-20130122/19197_1 /TAXON_ID=483371 /ORGANISM="non described non described, Strain CCMP2298" /LENGTH=66 /DNA_ID=CAMNT_0014128251 /DNA_START=1195 /DNA_END=1392 /DNA_ORIENTATION=+